MASFFSGHGVCTQYIAYMLQTAGMETDDLQAQLSNLQSLIADEEQKRHRQKVTSTATSIASLICQFFFTYTYLFANKINVIPNSVISYVFIT